MDHIKKLCVLLLFFTLLYPTNNLCMASGNNLSSLLIINFDTDSRLPIGLHPETTGHARFNAVWQVVSDSDAPSPSNILKITQIKAPSGGQFNICWTDMVSFRDGTITVRVRADRGRIDQGGGPMWRVTDRNNYYVARLNPLEDNFRIYYVKRGRRVMLAGADIHGIRAGNWFTIRIDARGNHITGWVNSKKLLETTDDTFRNAGGVGVWTKADAASSFDDIEIKIEEPK